MGSINFLGLLWGRNFPRAARKFFFKTHFPFPLFFFGPRTLNIVNLYVFFFAEQKKKNNINGAAGEKFFGYGVKI